MQDLEVNLNLKLRFGLNFYLLSNLIICSNAVAARQEEATVKRIKLEYDEIGSCMREVMEVWDLLISKESRVSARCDNQMLLQAIRQGVPRSKRGDVWHFLAEQYCLKIPPIDTTNFPNYNVPYEDLLRQLTSHQHAILIDLGEILSKS